MNTLYEVSVSAVDFCSRLFVMRKKLWLSFYSPLPFEQWSFADLLDNNRNGAKKWNIYSVHFDSKQ